MRTTTLRTRVARAGTALALCAGALAGVTVVGSPTAQATTPPAPAAPTVIFTEDFENVADPSLGLFIDDYTGATPTSMTYTADPSWISGSACNGVIASWNSTPGGTCTAGIYNAWARPMAQGLGDAFGGGQDNQAMIDTTVSGSVSAPTPAATLQTVSPVTLSSTNRFVSFSVDVGVVCNASSPLLRFYLLDGVTEIPVNNAALNPCTAPGTIYPAGGQDVRVSTLETDAGVLLATNQVGFKLTNDQSSGSGNDYAIDNVQILDATPQLTKDFTGGVTQQGQASTLVFTVTNTTELGAKAGWSFTDNLPAGVTVASTPNASSTCDAVTWAPTAGATSLAATAGALGTGDASCTLSVDVVAANGTYQNGPTNITATGLNPPAGNTSVKFNTPPVVTAGPAEGSTVFVGQNASYDYDCTDADSTSVTCGGTVPDGSAVDTSTPGQRSFTVTGTDSDGGQTVVVRTFYVVPTIGLCKGLAVGVLGINLGAANLPENPCTTRSSTIVDANVGIGPSLPPLLSALQAGVRAQALLGATISGPGTAAGTASVAKVNIGIPSAGLTLEVHGVHTSALSQLTSCSAPAKLTSSSRIQRITLNGKQIAVGEGAPITIPLVVGALHLNQKIEVGNTVIRRAVFLDLPGTALDVVIAESKAGATCAPAPVIT